MRIDVADACAVKTSMRNETQDLVVLRQVGLWQVEQVREHKVTLTQRSKRDFTDDEPMPENVRPVQQPSQSEVGNPEMIHPNGLYR